MPRSDDDESSSTTCPELETLDISNDQYYQCVKLVSNLNIHNDYDDQTTKCNSNPKQHDRQKFLQQLQIPRYGTNTIRHSLAAYDLWLRLFPTNPNFQDFHRPKLRHFRHGPQAIVKRRHCTAQISVKTLSGNLYNFQKRFRNRVIRSINNGACQEYICDKYLHIYDAKDLTAKRGELFLFEYSEEYPPVLSQVGMASNVKTISRSAATDLATTSKPITDTQEPTTITQATCAADHCEIIGIQETYKGCSIGKGQKSGLIYYHDLKPGEKFRVIENNLYRAPIYQHQLPETDFIIVRTRNSLYIREAQAIFAVGQTFPLVTIPRPSDKNITSFRGSLAIFHFDRLFREARKRSTSGEASVNFETMLKLFPDYSRAVFYKKFINKGCIYHADTKTFTRGSSTFGLQTLHDLRLSLTPEKYCTYMAMLAARERLRELNYTESMIMQTDDTALDGEVLAAPWNTTTAIHGAMTGKNYLDLKKHLIDPTGPQREGFSCVKLIRSLTEKQMVEAQQATTQSTSRENAGKSRSQREHFNFSKNPHAATIIREKTANLALFKREAQIIAETQASVLSSCEILTSDEEDEEADETMAPDENELDASFDEQLRDLDRLVHDGKTAEELSYEKEEEERIRMIEELRRSEACSAAKQGEPMDQSAGGANSSHEATDKLPAAACSSANASQETNSSDVNVASFKGKVLRIQRTYKSDNDIIKRTELVREPKIIALYLKMGGSKLKRIELNAPTGRFRSASQDAEPPRPRKRARRNLSVSYECQIDGGTKLTLFKLNMGNRSNNLNETVN